MEEIFKLIIGIFILILGVPIGNLLREKTKDEQKQGRKYFKIIVYSSLVLGFVGLLIGNDWIMFSFFFIAIVTSRSLVLKNKR
jgi:hypothetical protein